MSWLPIKSSLSTAGKAALKHIKLLAVLTQADLYPKFPDGTGPWILFCKLLKLPALLLTKTALGHSFKYSDLMALAGPPHNG